MTSDQRVEYTKAVFSEFRKLAKQDRDFSSAEFDLVRRWIDRGLPLASVLQGVRECGGKPRTLLACERSVEENVGRQAQATPARHPLLEPLSMAGWDPESERRRLLKKHGKG